MRGVVHWYSTPLQPAFGPSITRTLVEEETWESYNPEDFYSVQIGVALN